ncbi:KilA-N domain-containing protein [Aerosakkonemataceae cyanobacterium BLCC-F154]|uniref:KilA-N domain-containing protein n=1 Tax=Floridaenema fluviatile BLCC-F154 TaxID=3153640 RepID=A0ABV4Y4J2_9CYAN
MAKCKEQFNSAKQMNFNRIMIRHYIDDELVNLIDMWNAAGKPANKAPRDWIRLNQTQELLEKLVKQTGTLPIRVERKRGEGRKPKHLIAQIPGILIVSTEGKRAGTYAISKLAIDYYEYLSCCCISKLSA